MDKPAERIESETAGARPDSQNVVPIVETLRSQANTREREQRFNGLLDALPAAVYTTDAAGRITYYNEAAAELWGHRPGARHQRVVRLVEALLGRRHAAAPRPMPDGDLR